LADFTVEKLTGFTKIGVLISAEVAATVLIFKYCCEGKLMHSVYI